MRDLARLLNPKSIAIIGGGFWVENVIEQCRKIGFEGELAVVHPTKDAVSGIRAVKTVSDLEFTPDACFIGVNRHATIDIVTALNDIGAGGAVCFAGGFSEAGDTAKGLQEKLLNAAGDMPILGPNCYGILNMFDGVAIWPDQHGCQRIDRGVGIISQSSNIAITLTMQRRGLPIGYVACVGNAAQSGAADLAASMLADDRITALGMYLEGIEDPVALAQIAQDARRVGKPIVMIKSGKSAAGITAAASHTAAMAGSAVASSAYLAQAGIAEVDTLPELIETLKIYNRFGALGGVDISSASCSGGEAGMVADIAHQIGLHFPKLSDAQITRLNGHLGDFVTLSNPLDYNTFIWGQRDIIANVFREIATGVDATIYIIDPPRSDLCDPSSFDAAINAIADIASGDTPIFAVATLPDSYDEALIKRMADKGITALCGLEAGLRSIKAAATPMGRDNWLPLNAMIAKPDKMISEAEAKNRLRAAGIMTPNFATTNDIATASIAASELKPPFALKGMGFAHKTEAGAVRLNLTSLENQGEMIGASGYLIEEMVKDGIVEMLIGLRRDPVYGAALTVGFGGVSAELLQDSVTMILPIDANEILTRLSGLKLFKLLKGYRRTAEPDLKIFIDTILKVQDMFIMDPNLEEIEINPMILTKHQAIAVDALIRVGEKNDR